MNLYENKQAQSQPGMQAEVNTNHNLYSKS